MHPDIVPLDFRILLALLALLTIRLSNPHGRLHVSKGFGKSIPKRLVRS